jgi:DNA-directed RNA polymerase subunit RPC12/RpoP
MPVMKCLDCGHEFRKLFGLPFAKIKCPKCGSKNTVVARPM